MSGTDPGAYLPTRTGAHAAADLAPGTRLAGRFEIEGILGTVVEAAQAAAQPVALLDAVYALSRKRAEVMGLLPQE